MLLFASLLLAQNGLLKTVIPDATGQNGYEDYLRAAEIIQSPAARVYADWKLGASPPSSGYVEDPKTGGLKDGSANPALIAVYRRLNAMAPLDVRREELSKFGRVLDLVRAGNAKPAFDPRSEMGPDTLFPQFAAFKAVTRFAARAATVYAADGRTDRATAVLVDELEFADNTARGPLIAGLVGIADTAISLAAFGELLPRLSRADAVRIARETDALLARPPAARTALPAEMAFLRGALRKVLATNDPKTILIDPDEENNTQASAMAREFTALGREGRAALVERIEAQATARMAVMDRVLAGPEGGWVSGLDALREDEGDPPKDLEGTLSAMLLPEADTFKGFATSAVRSRTQLRLLGLHARLVQHRWDFGRFPESIDVLDPLTGGKYVYERHADGTIRLASKGLPSTGEIELKYKRPLPPVEAGAKP